ncbi:MAG: cytochrome P450, partial [Pseudonocardiaceae bacterium]
MMNVDPFTATGPGQRHAAYAALGAVGPAHRITLPSGELVWLITGHREVRQALHDPRIIKREATGAILGGG